MRLRQIFNIYFDLSIATLDTLAVYFGLSFLDKSLILRIFRKVMIGSPGSQAPKLQAPKLQAPMPSQLPSWPLSLSASLHFKASGLGLWSW